MKQVSMGLALMLAWTASVSAEAESAAKARQILEDAQKAAAQLTSVSYDALFLGDGMMAKHVPIMDGKVLAKRGPNGGADKVFVQGTSLPPRATEPWGFRYVSNGSEAMSVDDPDGAGFLHNFDLARLKRAHHDADIGDRRWRHERDLLQTRVRHHFQQRARERP